MMGYIPLLIILLKGIIIINSLSTKVNFAKLKGELQTMDKSEFTSLKKNKKNYVLI